MNITDKIKEFTSKKPFGAIEMYSITKYGEPLTEDQIFQRYVQTINEMLENKARKGYCSLIIDADSGFPEISNRIINLYNERGFNCFLLDSSIDSRIINPQIFIDWSR